MKLLSCHDHELRIAELESNIATLISAMSAVVEVMRTTHESSTTLNNMFQEFREGQAWAPPETTPGEPYHR